MAETFQCTIVTPEQQVLDEPVAYSSLPAWDGQVGIAPGRAPLLVKLGDGPLRLDTRGGEHRWFFVAGGFAKMKDNRLTLLTQEARPAAELSVETARAALREAEALVPTTDEAFARKDRDLRRARAMLETASHA